MFLNHMYLEGVSAHACRYKNISIGLLVTFLHQPGFCKEKNMLITDIEETNIQVVAWKLDVELPSKGNALMTKQPAVSVVRIFWIEGVTKTNDMHMYGSQKVQIRT